MFKFSIWVFLRMYTDVLDEKRGQVDTSFLGSYAVHSWTFQAFVAFGNIWKVVEWWRIWWKGQVGGLLLELSQETPCSCFLKESCKIQILWPTKSLWLFDEASDAHQAQRQCCTLITKIPQPTTAHAKVGSGGCAGQIADGGEVVTKSRNWMEIQHVLSFLEPGFLAGAISVSFRERSCSCR